MTIQQCKYILKIAECGSFNEAAKRLFVAQSSLSVSVKSLENELGIKIFERSGNGVYLTEEGTEFARYARQIAEQNDFILNRYSADNVSKRLYISTQHYDFVADIFVKLLIHGHSQADRGGREQVGQILRAAVVIRIVNAQNGVYADHDDYAQQKRIQNGQLEPSADEQPGLIGQNADDRAVVDGMGQPFTHGAASSRRGG